MATRKESLFKEAQKAGLISENAGIDDVTEQDLLVALGRAPVYEGSKMDTEPYTAPDGHVVVSQEDIDNRLPEPK
jgi:hypothetical protein